jgi:hypothetical protein
MLLLLCMDLLLVISPRLTPTPLLLVVSGWEDARIVADNEM